MLFINPSSIIGISISFNLSSLKCGIVDATTVLLIAAYRPISGIDNAVNKYSGVIPSFLADSFTLSIPIPDDKITLSAPVIKPTHPIFPSFVKIISFTFTFCFISAKPLSEI